MQQGTVTATCLESLALVAGIVDADRGRELFIQLDCRQAPWISSCNNTVEQDNVGSTHI
jgi:hypothetical protein